MPGIGRVTEASDVVPFLGAVVEFDLVVLREVPSVALSSPISGSAPHVASCR